MNTGLMMGEVLVEALPYLLWLLGFMIIYMISAAVDDAKSDSNEL